MINPQSINPSTLPSVSLPDREQLPTTPCVYFAIDEQGVVQYIGRSVNPQARWRCHHRYQQLSGMSGIKISYLLLEEAELLPEVEAALISFFQPRLNRECQESRVGSLRGVCMKRLSASIPDKLYERLEKLAEFEGRSVSNLVSYLLEHSLERKIEGYKNERGDRQ